MVKTEQHLLLSVLAATQDHFVSRVQLVHSNITSALELASLALISQLTPITIKLPKIITAVHISAAMGWKPLTLIQNVCHL